MKKFAIYTLGCKTNQYESQLLSELLRKQGWEDAGSLQEDSNEESTEGQAVRADAFIVNSCTVTAMADRKSRQYIRRARRENPDAVIALIGCYPQTHIDDARNIEELDIILGTQNKQKVVELIEEALKIKAEGGSVSGSSKEEAANIKAGDCSASENSKEEDAICLESSKDDPVCPEASKAEATDSFKAPDLSFPKEYCDNEGILGSESKTRALIKIQDGCNRFCSYCVIPYARGPVHSRPIESIVKEAEGLVAAGFKEIVLTGINTALYGSDWPGVEISGIDAVVEAISAIPGVFRIRLGSLEPTVINADYVKKLFKYDKLCHHLHLSVQSGSDAIIKAMNRNYTVRGYMDIVEALRDFDPGYGITTDIIVGFPGESEEDLEDSMELVRRAQYLKVHCFPYSQRPFTRAALMGDQIPMDIKRARNRELIAFADQVSLDFRSSLEGSPQRVLVEEEQTIEGRPYWKGHASNFCPVYIPKGENDSDIKNQFIDVVAGKPVNDGIFGRKE